MSVRRGKKGLDGSRGKVVAAGGGVRTGRQSRGDSVMGEDAEREREREITSRRRSTNRTESSGAGEAGADKKLKTNPRP